MKKIHKQKRYKGKSTCHKKIGYPTKGAALTAASFTLRFNDAKIYRTYLCMECGKYHLTTKEEKK